MKFAWILGTAVSLSLVAHGTPSPNTQSPAPATTKAVPALSPAADAVYQEWKKRTKAGNEAAADHKKAGKDMSTFKLDVAPDLAYFKDLLGRDQDPEARGVTLLAVMNLEAVKAKGMSPEAKVAADQALKVIPPQSPIWQLDPMDLQNLIFCATDEPAIMTYVFKVADLTTNLDARAHMLFLITAKQIFLLGNQATAKLAYEKLAKDCAGSKEAEQGKQMYEGFLKTKIGSPAPSLKIASLDDPKVEFTMESFKGRYVLVDFWATWCGPCVGELPRLHAVWEKTKSKKFDILSLSLDNKREEAVAFRKKPGTPMPWKNGYLEGTFKNPVAQAWGVSGIPKPVLIGPDGKIVAEGNSLRGEELEKTLAKYLGE